MSDRVPQCTEPVSCVVVTATATCENGYYVMGGGAIVEWNGDNVVYSTADSVSSWAVIAINEAGRTGSLRAQAVCALGPTPAFRTFSHSNVGTELARLRAEYASVKQQRIEVAAD